MDVRFLPHNSHKEEPLLFAEQDPHLRQLQQQTYIHSPSLLAVLPCGTPGIYTVTGGRQVGKTTLLKLWMAHLLLEEEVQPKNITYLTGELIDDHHSLVRLISEILGESTSGLRYLLLDEVTYIRGWDKGVKYLADAGLLEDVVLILTGSDLVIIQEARMRFPGRRGKAGSVDFHLFPLSFRETVRLKKSIVAAEEVALLRQDHEPPAELIAVLFKEFEQYLIHGGFLTAINDLALHNRILPATFMTYSDWIRGDVLKRGKQEHYLREILGAVVKRYAGQVTWNTLVKDLSIDHPKTVADYMALLASMDAVYVQPALREDKLAPSPKKARKVMFADPFILHAVRAWLRPTIDPYEETVLPTVADPAWNGRIAEACVTTHYRRLYPTYYIKAAGEVDIAYISKGQFWPVEVKWSTQLRPKDLKQVAKYPNSRILTKRKQSGVVMGVPTVPLPLALYALDDAP